MYKCLCLVCCPDADTRETKTVSPFGLVCEKCGSTYKDTPNIYLFVGSIKDIDTSGSMVGGVSP